MDVGWVYAAMHENAPVSSGTAENGGVGCPYDACQDSFHLVGRPKIEWLFVLCKQGTNKNFGSGFSL